MLAAHTCFSHTKHTQTCKNDEAVARLRVAQDAPSQQHVLVGQGILLLPPEQSPREAIQLVVWWLTHHLTCAQKCKHLIFVNSDTHTLKLIVRPVTTHGLIFHISRVHQLTVKHPPFETTVG